ncbi:MAG: 30S ribosomal protein S17 [Nanoarchaeota archaeon]
MTERKKEKIMKDKDSCNDVTCPVHGSLRVRGRTFKGYVIRKFPRRIAIEFERIVRVRKYERYARKKTRLHARLPACMQDDVKVGDYVLVGECRPLSKIIHFVFIKKIKEGEEKK